MSQWQSAIAVTVLHVPIVNDTSVQSVIKKSWLKKLRNRICSRKYKNSPQSTVNSRQSTVKHKKKSEANNMKINTIS